MIVSIIEKNLKNNKKNENEIKIRRFYLLCYSLFYCSARKTTSITYATIRKWSTLSFYDIKELLEIAEQNNLIEINEIDGKLKIDLLPRFYKLICANSYEDRNRLFVAANLKAATGQIARLMLFYMAGRVSYEKRSKLSDGPVRVSQIVSFFSKKFEFDKDGFFKKDKYNYGETNPYSRGLEKKIREVLREFGEKGLVLSEPIPREQLSEEEKKNKHGNIKQHILNVFPFYFRIENYCRNKNAYVSKSNKDILSLLSFDKTSYEKKKKEKKEKKENLKKEKLTIIDENLENGKPKKREGNTTRIGKKKQAIGLLLLKEKKIDEFLLFAQGISQNQSKIIEWFWGGLCKLTKSLYKKKPMFAKDTMSTKEKRWQGNHFRSMWAKLKKKSIDVFDMIKEAIKGEFLPEMALKPKAIEVDFEKMEEDFFKNHKPLAIDIAFPNQMKKIWQSFIRKNEADELKGWLATIKEVKNTNKNCVFYFEGKFCLKWVKQNYDHLFKGLKNLRYCLLPKAESHNP